jgi:hypothetical protein
MPRARSQKQSVHWVNLKFGSYTVKLLDVSRVKGRTARWPEIVMLLVPGPAKKKLQSRNALCEFLNQHEVFSKPARKVIRSVSLASAHTTWLTVVAHAKTSTVCVVWVPLP